MKIFRCAYLLGLLLTFSCMQAQSLPPNMYADTAAAPFLYGVASFDPTASEVILWTKVDPQGATSPISLTWEVFDDAGLTSMLSSGVAIADANTGWTAHVDVSFPQASQQYWYRWRDPQGNYSQVGRTKTAPYGQIPQARLAVLSCSSIYSGYFNAYKRISERNDIDLLVHLGDYIYDFVDADERVRVPVPAPIDPETLSEWRDRHTYYLLDPDLRAARQNHPWAAIWDNHDIDGSTPQTVAEAMQAFQEFLPMRLTNSANNELLYRKLSYGNLLDILLVDATSLSSLDTLVSGEPNMLGTDQFNWLETELSNSTASWRVIGQQRMMGHFSTAGLGSLISFGDGPVADSSAWDGFNDSRSRLLNFMDQNGIDNNVILSGDIHTSFLCDLPEDVGSYDAQTGAGSMAVEFLPTSVTRGNFDESGVTGFLIPLVQAAISVANSHHVYSELTSHGYGILDIRPDTVTAEFWYSPILQVSATESFAVGHQCVSGENHWRRNSTSGPTTVVAIDEAPNADLLVEVAAYPNPTSSELKVRVQTAAITQVSIGMLEVTSGKVVYEMSSNEVQSNQGKVFSIETNQFAAGCYQVIVKTDFGQRIVPVVISH